jgi:hypothetical protein
LQSVLCPIVEAVPRSLDEDGHFQVAVKGMEDEYGFDVENTPMGEMRTVIPTRLVGANFDGTTVDARFWTATVLNAATIAQANAQIVLTSGVNAAGSAQLNTLRRARYVSGTGMRFRAVIQLGDTGIAQNNRIWGIAYGATMPTITDGAYFELNGTAFRLATLRGGVATYVNNGSFNGTLGGTYNPSTVVNTYEIYWTNSRVYFVIGGELLHTMSATAQTWAATMSHHVYLSNINSGNTTSVTLTCRVASIARLGPLLTQPTSYYQAGTTAGVVLKYGAGNLHGLNISGVNNNSVITLYDNTAAAGTIIFSTGSMSTNATPFSIHFWGIPFFIGLTLVIATANSNAMVAYE